jgi:hypothetical protein
MAGGQGGACHAPLRDGRRRCSFSERELTWPPYNYNNDPTRWQTTTLRLRSGQACAPYRWQELPLLPNGNGPSASGGLVRLRRGARRPLIESRI